VGRRFDTISFLSDLGLRDETVGVVKAIVRDMAPHAHVVDLGHDIASYDVRAGSLALARSIAYVPAGVIIAAVDAGIDNGRPHIAIEVAGGDGVLVGPDNGLLAPAAAMAGGAERAVLLDRDDFHLASAGGSLPVRDVYAPVAAHLCNGVDLAELGTAIDADALLPGVVPLPRDSDDGGVVAEVLWVNQRGDCQLNVGVDDVAPWASADGAKAQVVAGTGDDAVTRVVERVAHAGRLGPGSIGLVVDPAGMLALCLQRRSAAEELCVGAGDQVVLRPLAEGDRGPGVTSSVELRAR
jgi:S-adenosylmethionine hydrolase